MPSLRGRSLCYEREPMQSEIAQPPPPHLRSTGCPEAPALKVTGSAGSSVRRTHLTAKPPKKNRSQRRCMQKSTAQSGGSTANTAWSAGRCCNAAILTLPNGATLCSFFSVRKTISAKKKRATQDACSECIRTRLRTYKKFLSRKICDRKSDYRKETGK